MTLKLIPVLEPYDAIDFLIQAKRNMTQDCVLIVSYPLPQGHKYETKRLASSSQSSVSEDSFEHGIIFRAPFDSPDFFSRFVEFPDRINQVINCYYTKEGFEKLVRQCGYKILSSITVGQYSDNDRVIAVLKI